MRSKNDDRKSRDTTDSVRECRNVCPARGPGIERLLSEESVADVATAYENVFYPRNRRQRFHAEMTGDADHVVQVHVVRVLGQHAQVEAQQVHGRQQHFAPPRTVTVERRGQQPHRVVVAVRPDAAVFVSPPVRVTRNVNGRMRRSDRTRTAETDGPRLVFFQNIKSNRGANTDETR